MFAGPHPPDALFAANDLAALGAMEALRKRGMRIPEDVLVAGFDDIPEAAWDAYRLTTFLQDGERMVAETLRLIERRGRTEGPGVGKRSSCRQNSSSATRRRRGERVSRGMKHRRAGKRRRRRLN